MNIKILLLYQLYKGYIIIAQIIPFLPLLHTPHHSTPRHYSRQLSEICFQILYEIQLAILAFVRRVVHHLLGKAG